MARDIRNVPMGLLTEPEIEAEIQRRDEVVQAERSTMRALNAELTRRHHADRAAAKVAAMSPGERAAMEIALATMPAQSINVAAVIPSQAAVLAPGAG